MSGMWPAESRLCLTRLRFTLPESHYAAEYQTHWLHFRNALARRIAQSCIEQNGNSWSSTQWSASDSWIKTELAMVNWNYGVTFSADLKTRPCSDTYQCLFPKTHSCGLILIRMWKTSLKMFHRAPSYQRQHAVSFSFTVSSTSQRHYPDRKSWM